MNRYPLWKYAIVIIVLLLGLVYTLPNFFGQSPAVQVSSGKSTILVDARTQERIEEILKASSITHDGIFLDNTGVKIRLSDADTQLKVKDLLNKEFNPAGDELYVIALNLLSSSPQWLTNIGARPMNLGLDLRGGVHFLLQVDMKGAITKRLDSTATDIRSQLRDKSVKHSGIKRENEQLVIKFPNEENRNNAKNVLSSVQPDLVFTPQGEGADLLLVGIMKPAVVQRIQEESIKQNMLTLHNRINELGVAEPVITQQGMDRIVVQLPGIQDVSEAKRLIGRTATLEVRMVDEDAMLRNDPAGTDVVTERRADGTENPIFLKKQVILTGDRFSSADATFDQNQRPAVSVKLDSAGGNVMQNVTRENLKKQMAIVLYEKGKGEAISVATIQGEFGRNFQITGNFSTLETTRLAILIRAGALAAPMEIIEERTIGPSLGAESIQKGFHSTLWGFVAVGIFMMAYYALFGVVSIVALGSNLLLLVALLSLLQATLTLPGIAAIALTLGMAIDSNVLINERIREELRVGVSPQLAIFDGYKHAFDTIFDTNITTLIAGMALLIFGSGPVRGFAVVHCLGIITSLFSSVVVSRALVNLIYGNRRKLETLSIGQVWRPEVMGHTVAGKR